MTLRVILQIVPGGREELAYEIGRMNVSNVGDCEHVRKGEGTQCWYVANIDGDDLDEVKLSHTREDGAWALVRKVLDYASTL